MWCYGYVGVKDFSPQCGGEGFKSLHICNSGKVKVLYCLVTKSTIAIRYPKQWILFDYNVIKS